MSIYIAHPLDAAQENAVKAFFEALKIPYETKLGLDETEHLLSTAENAKRLKNAIQNEKTGKAVKISLDEIWK